MIEINKQINILEEYDVAICGAGPAGMCAAMAASRQGVKVALIERFGVIGGNLTSGHVGPILGSVARGTMADEINELLGGRMGLSIHNDIEITKIKLMDWIHKPNIDLFLNTPIVDVINSGDSITGIIIGTQSGLAAIRSKIIIDATGDGIVSYLSGAETEIGRPGDGLVQPVTIMFTISGVDKNQKIVCEHEEDDTLLDKGSYLDLTKQASLNGALPASVNIVRLYRTKYEDERMVNATQLNHINGLEIQDIGKAHVELRRQMPQVLEFLKNTVPGFENCKIKDSSDIIGIRETRRVIGEYELTDTDLVNGRTFEDVMVHRAAFCIDIHNPDGAGQAETEGRPHEVKPYDIPYRCFVPLKVNNLLTAGRCISGSHRAHASYRVMNICMAMGEAAGTAGALCAITNTIPRNLNYKKVQDALISKGIELF